MGSRLLLLLGEHRSLRVEIEYPSGEYHGMHLPKLEAQLYCPL